MKKGMKVGLTTALSLVCTATICIKAIAYNTSNNKSKDSVIVTSQINEKQTNNISSKNNLSISNEELKNLSITIKEDPSQSYKVTKEDALKVANEFINPSVTNSAKNILVQYYLFTDSSMTRDTQKIEDVPAWIVVYDGINIATHSAYIPQDKSNSNGNNDTSKQNVSNGKIIVVIDAITGKMLESVKVSSTQ